MSTGPSKIRCPVCSDDVDVMWYLQHLPACYYDKVSQYQEPMCTCPKHKGRRAHTSDVQQVLLPSKKKKNEVKEEEDEEGTPPPSNKPSDKSSTTSKSSIKTDKTSSKENQLKNSTREDLNNLEPSQLAGKHCLLPHANYKSPSQQPFPLIHVGTNRQLMICAKGHLGVNEDVKAILKIVTEEVRIVRLNGDGPVNLLVDGTKMHFEHCTLTLFIGSQEEDISDQIYECHGYKAFNPEVTKCEELCSDLLWCDGVNNTKYYFCSPNHLLRYYLKVYGASGKPVTKPTPSQPAATKTKPTKSKTAPTPTTTTTTTTTTTKKGRAKKKEDEDVQIIDDNTIDESAAARLLDGLDEGNKL